MPRTLTIGEPAPWFTAPSTTNPSYQFHTVAGRYIVLSFFGSAGEPGAAAFLRQVVQRRDLLDDENICFFGVSTDPEDERQQRVQEMVPGIRFFRDYDHEVSRMFGADPAGEAAYYRHTLILDERLRVVAVLDFDPIETHGDRLFDLLRRLPPLGTPYAANMQAPVLVAARIFEPELCRRLIQYYEERGGEPSGFMRDVGGKTVMIHERGHKLRRDQTIDDDELRKVCMWRIHDRLVSEVHKAFQFRATRIERYIVACYESESQGHFRPHRDNTTRGTAHRRFAVSLNLNTGQYDGGELRFPEFGRYTYSAPAGGAVVFSCSLLHEATPVTRGRRYVFLPFLYDEEGAKIRETNRRFLAENAPTDAG